MVRWGGLPRELSGKGSRTPKNACDVDLLVEVILLRLPYFHHVFEVRRSEK